MLVRTSFLAAAMVCACGTQPSPVAPKPAPSSVPSGVAVPFETGTRSILAGDDLVIDEIRGDRAALAVGGKYTLRGHYRLRSHDAGSLMLYVTSGDAIVEPRQIEVRAGDGTFEMHFTLTKLGFPHLSIYPTGGGNSFAMLYFGQEQTLDTYARAATPPCTDVAAKQNGWLISGGGGNRHEYCVTRDEDNARNGRAPLHLIKRADVRGEPYGTLMKVIDPTPYLGKRIRIELDVRTQNATQRRDVWARVQAKSSPSDGSGLGGSWETLPETADWSRRSIVLDVPLNAASIHYGVGIAGAGELWVDNDSISVVDPSVPLTNPPPVVVEGWRLMGVGRADYAIAVDATTKHGANKSIAWKLVQAPSKRWAALVRVVPAIDLRAQRVRVTRWIRTKDAEEMSCIVKVQRNSEWTYGPVLAFDYEKIPPTRDWYKCESVLDVSTDADWILAGVTGRGGGQTWVDDLKIEAVSGTTPLTQHSP